MYRIFLGMLLFLEVWCTELQSVNVLTFWGVITFVFCLQFAHHNIRLGQNSCIIHYLNQMYQSLNARLYFSMAGKQEREQTEAVPCIHTLFVLHSFRTCTNQEIVAETGKLTAVHRRMSKPGRPLIPTEGGRRLEPSFFLKKKRETPPNHIIEDLVKLRWLTILLLQHWAEMVKLIIAPPRPLTALVTQRWTHQELAHRALYWTL